MPRLQGAYSTVVMTKRAVVAFRDPHGVRPLSLGKLGERYVIASESCAFDIIGAELVREVAPGELISLTDDGMEARQVVPSSRRAHCVSSTSTSPARTPGWREGPPAGARTDGGDPVSGGSGRGRPGDLGSRLGEPRRTALRGRRESRRTTG